jgi:hypothetical protein
VTILTGWREQYDRMRRTYDRWQDLATGQVLASSEENKDAMIHFFQNAYHLKDWIKNDENAPISRSARRKVEKHVNRTEALRLCADLCNGTKHFGLRQPLPKRRWWQRRKQAGGGARTGDPTTAFASQSVAIRPATVGARITRLASGKLTMTNLESAPPQPAQHSWTVESKGKSYDVASLANDVLDAWDHWLRQRRLLP